MTTHPLSHTVRGREGGEREGKGGEREEEEGGREIVGTGKENYFLCCQLAYLHFIVILYTHIWMYKRSNGLYMYNKYVIMVFIFCCVYRNIINIFVVKVFVYVYVNNINRLIIGF